MAAGSTLTVQVGSNAAHTLTFGTGAGQISTKAELTSALAAFTDVTGGYNGVERPAVDADEHEPDHHRRHPGDGDGARPQPRHHHADRDGRDREFHPRHPADQLQLLLTQIDQLAGDSSYNGVNLLNGDNLRSTSTRPAPAR